MDTGLIHIYCGDGKGKTTASLGLVLRCAGRGGKILFAQFLKGRPTGELEALKALPQVKPAHTEVVLTGRDPSPALLDLADYVSEIKKIKHPFDRGLAARIGIEE